MTDIETRYWGRLSDEQLPIEAREIAWNLRQADMPNVAEMVEELVDRLGAIAEDVRRAERDAKDWEETAHDLTEELKDARNMAAEQLDKLQRDLDDALNQITME